MDPNPYASPRETSEYQERATPYWLQAMQFCGLTIAASVLLGVLANVLNGWICPEYFVWVMGWDENSNIWLRSILQGAFEGGVIGGVLSIVFFASGSLLTKFRLTFGRAVRYLAAIVGAAVVAGIVLGLLFMTIKERLLIRVLGPATPDLLQRFAWVAGCIAGLERGGALATFLALIVLVVRDWRKMRTPAADANSAPAD